MNDLPAIGDTLPNHAIVIAVKKSRREGEFVVLALNAGSYQPYVVWVGSLENYACASGDYTSDLGRALKSYNTRD